MIDPPTSHAITVNAAEQDHLISTVTVFQTGRAEIKRRIQLQLKKGHNQITIEHLPSCLVEDSLRVQGTGTATIFDVLHHSPKPEPRYGRRQVNSDSSDEENEEEAESYNAIEDLKKQRNVIEKQISFLDKYGQSVDGQNSDLETLERFLDTYGSRREILDKRMSELNSQVGRAEKALRITQKKNSRHERRGKRRTKITVSVMSKEEGKAELTLAYVVSNASWIPIYEIRASISSSPNTPSTIALHYRASLTQTTGEDWSGVALTLSTAAPYRGANMPTLSTWRIGLPLAHEPRRHLQRERSWSPQIIRIGTPAYPSDSVSIARRSRSRSRSRSPTRIIDVDRASDYRSRRSITPPLHRLRARVMATHAEEEPTPMVFRQADGVDSGVLSATFNIPGRSNIPSDQGSHNVLIASLDFQVDPEWVCIPRKDESAFLGCKVINSSEFTFLPGEASVFIGESFVSKSQIQHVPPSDSFHLSLGTDPTLRVAYAPVRTHKRARSQTGFAFPGRPKQPKQEATKYSQLILIRNTRPTAVPTLHILDHVPVSNDSTIKVNVTSPQGLRENNRPTEDDTDEKQHDAWVHPQKGVKARWAPPNIGGEGAIEWVCAINAGEEIELKLGWEINAPEGTKWGNL
ncbi:unnamed protein product [Rhizoctonia solani]|uniref:Protein F37C4,5 [Caenorhabditis elegans] n=1 Tax=Rhizoctonia solani TaxID=456999 RepID=A0A8H3CQ56_9AGAM|nr:unnamed protein product [Rhizoctonia solani]